MTDINFKVDKNKCIHCGLCINDCIAKVFEFDEDKTPKAVNPQRCIGCGHCLSVCPAGAVSVFGKNPDDSQKALAQNPVMVLNLIQSRRRIRN